MLKYRSGEMLFIIYMLFNVILFKYDLLLIKYSFAFEIQYEKFLLSLISSKSCIFSKETDNTNLYMY